METPSNTNVTWDCSICTYKNQLQDDLCDMCGAKNPNTSEMWQCYKCSLFNFNERCNACFNEAPPFLRIKKLTVSQMIYLLIRGYLKSISLNNSIIEINRLIQTFYACHDTNPDNFIGKMIITPAYLNDAVEMFSNQKHSVVLRSSSEMICFSLQSQTKHAIKCAHRYQWTYCNGNLISLERINSNNYDSIIYDIASNKTCSISFLNSDRLHIGCCASKKRGIFSIGGYYQDKDIDSTDNVHNIQWNGNVTQLASYWHRTWSSKPLFIDNDNKIINIGGGHGPAGHCSQIVGLYDFEKSKWQRLADIPYDSQSSGACYNKFDETVYVTGGYVCDTKLCVRYSGRTNQWEQIGETNWSYNGMHGPCLSVINNSFVLVTSEGDNGLKMEYLDIRTNCKRFTILVGNEKKGNRWERGPSMYNLITNNF